MTNKFIFTPNEADLRAAYGLHLQRSGWKRMGYLMLFGLVIGLILAALEGFDNPAQVIGVIVGMTLWAGLVAAIMQFLLPRWWVPRLARKIYRQQKDLHLETETWWDDDKFYSANAQGQAHFLFSDLTKWRGNDDIVLLYRSDQLFNFLPGRIFTDSAHRDGLIRRIEQAGVSGDN